MKHFLTNQNKTFMLLMLTLMLKTEAYCKVLLKCDLQ